MDDARRTSSPISTTAFPSAYYAAGLIGVVVFLLLFMIFPEPISQYTAQAELEQEAIGGGQGNSAASLISQATVDQLANELLANESPTILFRSEVLPVNEMKTKVRIEIAARYANEALSLARSLAEKIIASQPTTITPRELEQRSLREDVLRRLAITKETERAVEDDIAKLERQHLEQSLAQMSELAAPAKSGASQPELSDLALAWQAARGRLQDLEKRRAELMVTRTEAHPLVQEVNYQIQQQLETIAGLPPEPAGQQTSAATTAVADLQQALRAYQTRLTELRTNRETIRTRREQLESDLLRLSQPAAAITLRTAISNPATIIDREGGRPSPLRLTAMMIAASIAAVATYSLAKQMGSQQPLNSIEQVQRELGLPVVTVMKIGQPHFRERAESNWFRSAVFFAELIVVMLVFAFALAYSSVEDLSQGASEDPLGVVAETFDRMGETVRR